jgi:hypothetical protein
LCCFQSIGSGYGNNANPSETMELPHYVIDFSLCYQNCILNITSTDTVGKVNGDGLFGVLIVSIACSGFDFSGVGFCVAFKVSGGAQQCQPF